MFVPYVVHSMAPFGLHTAKISIIRSYSLQYGSIRIRLTYMRSHYSISADLGPAKSNKGRHIVDTVFIVIQVVSMLRAMKFFSKLNEFIFGYFDPINVFFDNTNKYFSE